jgi:endonuclease YncB( thermonuclease family)
VRLELARDENMTIGGELKAYAELADGRCLNVVMLEAGLARCDGSWHERAGEFAAAQGRGQRGRAGMWAKWQEEEQSAGQEGGDDDEQK